MLLTGQIAISRTLMNCLIASIACFMTTSCGVYYSNGARYDDKTHSNMSTTVPIGSCKVSLSIVEDGSMIQKTYTVRLSFNTGTCQIKLSDLQVSLNELKKNKGKFWVEKVSLFKHSHDDTDYKEENFISPLLTFTVTDNTKALVYTYVFDSEGTPSKRLQIKVKGQVQTDSTITTFSDSATFKRVRYLYMN